MECVIGCTTKIPFFRAWYRRIVKRKASSRHHSTDRSEIRKLKNYKAVGVDAIFIELVEYDNKTFKFIDSSC